MSEFRYRFHYEKLLQRLDKDANMKGMSKLE